jgi:hypothetical protein
MINALIGLLAGYACYLFGFTRGEASAKADEKKLEDTMKAELIELRRWKADNVGK